MSEGETEVKKGTGLKIALVIVSTLFVISLLINLYLYNRQYGVIADGGLENQIANLQIQVSNLQHEIRSLKSARLVKVDLQTYDNRSLLQTPYLHIVGYIANVGTYTAYNCTLHVTLYQGAVVAENTRINIGTIWGEKYCLSTPWATQWKSVDSRVYYEGEALSSYSIILKWD